MNLTGQFLISMPCLEDERFEKISNIHVRALKRWRNGYYN